MLASANRVAAAERKRRTAQQMSFVFGENASADDIASAEALLASGADGCISEIAIALDNQELDL